MKTRNLFLSLFAFAALCACNKEEVPSYSETLEGDAYIAVNIVTSGDAFTKAVEGQYASGTEDAVSTAHFLFFRDNEFVTVSTPTFNNFTGPDNADPNANLSKKSEAVIVLENETPTPDKLLVILNTSDVYINTLVGNEVSAANKTLPKVLATVGDYAHTSGNFLMTNSVYASDDEATIYNATSIDPSKHLKATADAAKSSPVDVYVERVNSKVVVKKGGTFTDNNTFELDGNTVELRHNIVGFAVTPTIGNTHLFKNIDGIKTSTGYWNGWNDLPNYRSYWAVNAASPEFTYSQSFDDADDNYTANWIEAASGSSQYTCYPEENVLQSDDNPKLIVAVKIEKKVSDDPETWEGVTAYNYATKWYTESYLLSMAQNALSAAGYPHRTAANLEVVPVGTPAKDYEVKIQFKDSVIDETEPEKTVLNNLGYAKKWDQGECYFYVDIEHFGKKDGNVLKGLVRNHQYEISINSITGWGTPIDLGIGGGIEPEDPTDNSYVAATINILKWKVVNQDVELN